MLKSLDGEWSKFNIIIIDDHMQKGAFDFMLSVRAPELGHSHIGTVPIVD